MSGISRRKLITAAGAGAIAVPFIGAGTAAAGQPPAPQHPGSHGVVNGADRAAKANWSMFAGKKVGVVTNPTGILTNLRSIVDEMHESGKVNIVGVFGPEHGFRGTAQAGGSEGTFIDQRTGLTVYDAYGATTEKLAGMFTESKLDTVVFDIQDVGARFYTYIWTLYTAMKAAVSVGAEVVVFDRPNPQGGRALGPMMTPAYESGVGAERIVQAHGMTIGELARYFRGEFLKADTGGKDLSRLTVVQMTGYRPDMKFADTGQTWVTPSPNMPTPDTALLYAGTCMFEGTNLAEGRGTCRPFELIGAPYADHHWAETLAARHLPGVHFREAYFVPTFNKYVNEVCSGVQVHITDPVKLDPIRVAVEMLVAAHRLYPTFAWRYDSYDPARPYWIDKLTGSTRLRDQITAGDSADTVIWSWRSELAAFDRSRQKYLIYRGRR